MVWDIIIHSWWSLACIFMKGRVNLVLLDLVIIDILSSIETRSRDYKTFIMLNLTDYEIATASKNKKKI